MLLLFVLKNRFLWACRHHCPGSQTHKSLLIKAARHRVRDVVSAHHVRAAWVSAAITAQDLCHVPSEDGQVLGEPVERGGKGWGQWQGRGCMKLWMRRCGVQDRGQGPRSGWAPSVHFHYHYCCHQHPSQETRVITKYTLTILRGVFCGYSI